MPSPVLPAEICATVPSSTDPLCDKLESLFGLSQKMCTWFSWSIKANGDPSDAFIAWLTALSIPVGTVIWRPVSTVPTGYLQANGQTVSRVTYASLFTVIGTAYGAGDASTTFGVPNISGRMLIGNGTSNAVGAATRNVGDVGGAEQVTISTAQLPAHTHTISSEKDAAGGGAGHYMDQLNETTHTPSDNTQATNAAGGGQALNVMNPTMAGLFLIKF